MTVQSGTLLADRYRVVRVIGEGGMGVVVEAENIVTQKRVAVKWLHAQVASNPEASQRLVNEGTAACRIRHPNVVDVYDVVRDDSSIFLVMELLEGETLKAVLQRGGMPLPELVALLIPAMRGVAEGHRCDVIHRDIHPANIFLARSGSGRPPVPKVLDFGISKIDHDQGKPSLTRSGMTMGNPLYMSYEQLYNARDVDARTDVYSFGVVLYEALTGQPPFDGDTFTEIAVKIVTGAPVPPKQLRPEIPQALERLVQWAMARDREDRIPNLDALADELEPFAAEHAFRAQMTDSERPMPALAARPERAVSPVPPAAVASPKLDTQGRVSSPLSRSSPAPALARSSELSTQVTRLVAIAAVIVAGVAFAWWRGASSELRANTDPSAPLPPFATPAPTTGATPAPQRESLPSGVLTPVAPLPRQVLSTNVSSHPNGADHAPEAAPSTTATTTPSRVAETGRTARPRRGRNLTSETTQNGAASQKPPAASEAEERKPHRAGDMMREQFR